MPEQKETTIYDSYPFLAGLTSEEDIETTSAPASIHLGDQKHTTPQSFCFTTNLSSFLPPRSEDIQCNSLLYKSSEGVGINHSPVVPETDSLNSYIQGYQISTLNHSSTTSFVPNFSVFNNCNNNSSGSDNNSENTYNNNKTSDNYHINSNVFELPSTSKSSSKNQQPSFTSQQGSEFSSSHISLLNSTKVSKSNFFSTPKLTSTCSSKPKYLLNKNTHCEKNLKSKNEFDLFQKSLKLFKDDCELNCNIGELQQLFSEHGFKVKGSQDSSSDLVTDAIFNFLQKKTQENNFLIDFGDVNQILQSLTNKLKSEEILEYKKLNCSEDTKLMNDLVTKIILEKEEERFKLVDNKKQINRKEIGDDLNNDLYERKIIRDAMSHYPEDKNHHKRPSNYSDLKQWDYLNQQEIQASNSHSRRGHFFGGTSQAHSVGWNPMGVGIPRQTNPYYSSPHGHVMPAHAHAEYRYNQWNNPNHKSVPNIQNAHSQNTLPQAKHHGEVQNSIQEFGLPVGSTPDLSKLRNTPLIRSSTSEKSIRPTVRQDPIGSLPPTIRNSSALRTPPLGGHSKTVINNPLSDIQMLVTNQNENTPQKSGNYQQESVDLSAHSETSKQKENSLKEDDKTIKNNNKDSSESRTSVSVIQTQNKEVKEYKPKSHINDIEKPVELTSKITEKSAEVESLNKTSVNNVENKHLTSDSVEDKKEVIKDVDNLDESIKTSVIVEKEKSSCINNCEKEDIPRNLPTNSSETEPLGQVENAKQVENSSVSDCLKNTEVNCKSNNGDNSTLHDGSSELEQKDFKETTLNEKCNSKSELLSKGKRKAEDEEADIVSKKAYLEVESQLEKMFEGIVENSDTVTSTSAEIKSTPSGPAKKSPKKKPTRKSRAVRLSSGQSSGSESHFASKKFKSKEDQKKKLKKSFCDVIDRRGPFLHVEGSKESPSSVTVINFPKGDDEDEKDKNFIKKQNSSHIRTRHHNELDYRGRSRNGLFSSTLSARYDAHTTDHTWICVFCKKGPHYGTLGDLFGPYIISKDENNSLCDFSGDEKDISDAQKRGGRNKKSLRSNNMVDHFQKMSKKLRRAQSNDSCLTGMAVISDEQVDQLRYEVWVHEQCAVWSPNVCLIGSRIIGMQEAIWCSVKTMCSKCGAFGANIGCIYRNCPNRSHYYCAKESGWSLEQETFISTCHIHKTRS